MIRLQRWTLSLVALVLAACSSGTTSSTPERGAPSGIAGRAALTAPTPPATCAPPDGSEAVMDFDKTPLVVLCHGVYADPATTSAEREQLEQWYVQARKDVQSIFGPAAGEPPVVVFCSSKACIRALSGPTERSHASMRPRPTIYVNGIGANTRGTITHEMTHVVIARKTTAAPSPAKMPTWFEEGVATFIGDNASCPAGTKPAIDDLRRLSAAYAWTNFTNQPGKLSPTYCQAQREVAARIAQDDVHKLVSMIDAVIGGRSFDDVYGPLVLPGAPSSAPILDAAYALDENTGSSASDRSGQSRGAALGGGTTWAPGHRGSAVRVSDGGYIHASGLTDFGLPDRAFSISLWVRPAPGAKVLVHSSKNADGGNGWCIPILGHDASGRLTAQVTFDVAPEAFLTATGPVLSTQTWSHVAMTWSADDGVRLYVNGALSAESAPQTPAQRHRDVPATPMHLFFGSDRGASCWPGGLAPGSYKGTLDEIRVYNYALSPAQVISDMTAEQ